MHVRSILTTAVLAFVRELAAALGDDPPALQLYRSPAILAAWRIAG